MEETETTLILETNGRMDPRLADLLFFLFFVRIIILGLCIFILFPYTINIILFQYSFICMESNYTIHYTYHVHSNCITNDTYRHFKCTKQKINCYFLIMDIFVLGTNDSIILLICIHSTLQTNNKYRNYHRNSSIDTKCNLLSFPNSTFLFRNYK